MKKRIFVMVVVLVASMVFGSFSFVLAADDTYTSNNNKIVFQVDPNGPVTPPVDPEDPDKPGDPDDKEEPTGHTTPIRLDLVPRFDFGTQNIAMGAKSYKAILPIDANRPGAEPYFAQITDLRGTGTGWSLNAKMTKQFTNGTNVLSGAEITLKNLATEAQTGSTPSVAIAGDKVLKFDAVNDTSVKLATAAATQGVGVSVVRFGDTILGGNSADTAKDSVVLSVPASTIVYAGTYTATILWTLSETP